MVKIAKQNSFTIIAIIAGRLPLQRCVCKKDNKSALKYYNKVLKLSPNDYTAAKNCVLMARAEKDVKLEKKYLPILIRATEDEAERLSAEARLKSL